MPGAAGAYLHMDVDAASTGWVSRLAETECLARGRPLLMPEKVTSNARRFGSSKACLLDFRIQLLRRPPVSAMGRAWLICLRWRSALLHDGVGLSVRSLGEPAELSRAEQGRTRTWAAPATRPVVPTVTTKAHQQGLSLSHGSGASRTAAVIRCWILTRRTARIVLAKKQKPNPVI